MGRGFLAPEGQAGARQRRCAQQQALERTILAPTLKSWEKRSSSMALGRTVIGIMSAGFAFPSAAEAWIRSAFVSTRTIPSLDR